MADYLIYDTASKDITGAYRGRSAAPTAESGETAVAVDVASSSMVGQVYDASGIYHKATLPTLRFMVEEVMDLAFREWKRQVREHFGDYPISEYEKANDYLYWGAVGADLTVYANRSTPAWCIAYIGQVVRGAADTANADEFFEETGLQAAKPTGAVSWVQTDSGIASPARLNLAQSVAVAGALPHKPFDFKALSARLRA